VKIILIKLNVQRSRFNAKRTELPLDAVKTILFAAMNFEYDIGLIGGVFSGAATALESAFGHRSSRDATGVK
jgi:hypothetical protein